MAELDQQDELDEDEATWLHLNSSVACSVEG